jgi:molybdopterin-guanine dinucleotide biosynthesis protein
MFAQGDIGIGRRILSVIGPHSGCGKTTFVVHVVQHIRQVGCLKISPAYDQPKPFPCDEKGNERDFYLQDPAELNHHDKDTALYLRAGAARVERLRHRGDGLAAGLEEALKCFPPDMPIIVESSSAVPHLRPPAVVMVVRPPIREVKPATRAVLSSVTDLMVNASDRDASTAVEIGRLRRDFPALRPQFTWSADLIRETPPEEMLGRLKAGLIVD